jgi:hypothetical protein
MDRVDPFQNKRPGTSRPRLSLRDLEKEQYYTLSEARLLLNPPADRRTLNAWIEELGIPIFPSPVRGHSLLISRKDLTTIASLVGRSLKGEQPLHTPPQLSDLEARQEREIATLRAQIERMKRQHLYEIASLKQELETLRQQVQRELPRSLSSTPQSSVARASSSEEDTERSVPEDIPPELVKPHSLPPGLPSGTTFLRWFALRHGATRDVTTAAAKRGDIRAIARVYGKGTQYFLDPQMQDEAVAWLVRRGYGHPCEYCPHSAGTPSQKTL